MPALKPKTIIPTPEEDAAISAAALSDPNVRPLTEKEWKAARPFVKIGRAPGRPPHAAPRKASVTLRLDVDVLASLKSTGKGWQTRVNSIMREWLKTQRAA